MKKKTFLSFVIRLYLLSLFSFIPETCGQREWEWDIYAALSKQFVEKLPTS